MYNIPHSYTIWKILKILTPASVFVDIINLKEFYSKLENILPDNLNLLTIARKIEKDK
jgi:hypothetical protein